MANFVILPTAEIVGRDISVDDFFEHLNFLPKGWYGRIALDTETTGLDIMADVPVYASISDGDRRWLLLLEHLIDPRMSELLLDDERVWVFANAKYDMHMLANVGLPEIKGDVVDVIVMCMLRDENRKERRALGLKAQAKDYLNINHKSFKDTFNVKLKGAEGIALLSAPLDLVAGYASLDAYATWKLSHEHAEHLCKDVVPENYFGFSNLYEYYWNLEVPFTKTLFRMERRGIQIDQGILQRLEPVLEEECARLKKKINRLAGWPINPNSSVQVQKLFYGSPSEGGLGLKATKWTASGNPSTKSDALSDFANDYEIAEVVLDYRTKSKFLSTYVRGIQRALNSDGRVRCQQNQTGTVTGRLSVEKPGLQQIPSHSELGHEIRKAFIAKDGHSLFVSDYSQMEMCIMAHLSNDKSMIEAIAGGQDIHSYTASVMLGVEYDDVVASKAIVGKNFDESVQICMDKFELSLQEAEDLIAKLDRDDLADKCLKARNAAKAIGFGLMYGKGAGSLSKELNVPLKEGKNLIELWFSAFPSVKNYMEWVREQAENEQNHSVYGVLGRPRRLTSVTSSNRGVKAKALRDAVNAPIQGSASCIMKHVMNVIDQDPELGGNCIGGGSLGTALLLQVHDEIMLEVPKNEEIEKCVAERLRKIMTEGIQLRVPLKAEGGIASSWAEAK